MSYSKGFYQIAINICAVLFALYFLGIYGFLKGAKTGNLDRPIEFYAEAFVYNFLMIVATAYSFYLIF